MKNLSIIFLLLFSLLAQSQDKFLPGYYIDQSNATQLGFIEEIDSYNNVDKIYFKKSADEKASEINIDYLKEFKIDFDYKYVKFDVEYDFGQVVNKSAVYVYGKEPKLQKKTVLLKVLVEGEFTLYKGIIDDFVFFYSKKLSDELPRLLIHRKYNDNNIIKENNDFRKQLYDDMKSETLVIGDFFKLDFKESDFVDIFTKANKNSNSLVEQNLNLKNQKDKFYYKVFAGTSAPSSAYTYRSVFNLTQSKVSYVNPILGFEFSNVTGSNSKKSEVFTRFFYQQINSDVAYIDNEFMGFSTKYDLKINLHTINLSAGYRYRLSKNQRNTLFVDASLGAIKVVSSDLIFSRERTYVQPSPNQGFTDVEKLGEPFVNIFFNLGIGYVFNKRYSINFEYSLPKNLLNGDSFWSGSTSNLNLFFTYTLNK